MAQAQQNTKGMAVASLVLGIIAVVSVAWWFIALPAGVLAIIFGAISLKTPGRSMGIAGIVTGVIGVVIAAIIAVIFIVTFTALPLLQEGQRDTARKQEVSQYATEITEYRSNNNGAFPNADELVGSGVTGLIKTVAASGNPTTDTLVYTVGQDCTGAASARAYSLRIMLESGSEYCTDM